jgi:hypothetical protein
MQVKKWIIAGGAGALGVAILGATAVQAASNLRLEDEAGQPLHDKQIVANGITLPTSAQFSIPTAASAVSVTVVSAKSVASPNTVNSPASPKSVQSPVSPKSPKSPASPKSPKSPVSPKSAQSAASVD